MVENCMITKFLMLEFVNKFTYLEFCFNDNGKFTEAV